jgi:pimeloyl-ACP methyl ester carboxylesterase
MKTSAALAFFALAAFAPLAAAQTAQSSLRVKTVTRDIPFTSHDGYAMVGRLTLPESQGPHPVLVLVQTAEAATMDGELRNVDGIRVRIYNQYRERLAPLGIGFFSYEGRGVTSNAGGGPVIDRPIYATSTLANKVEDGISAVRLLRNQPDVDASRIVLRAISEGTLLAAEIAVKIPKDIAGLVLSGVLGSTLKDATLFMASDGAYMAHLQNWDINADGHISAAEFEADPKGIRKQMPAGATFAVFDRNNDGTYTRDELMTVMKPILDAIRDDDIDGYVQWLQGAAAVQVPGSVKAWVQDHLRQPPMWNLLAQLSMPIGIFQGEADHNTSADGVRALERQANAAGKHNMEFHYFPGLDHGLGTIEYFNTGVPSAGYVAIFEYMRRFATSPVP